jgi:acetylornithine deacetylase/succinyl-diaminopimelate desuccinylase-like protein
MSHSRLVGLVLFAASGALSTLAQGEPITPTLVEQTSQRNFPEFIEMLSLPNDSASAADIQKNAAWLEEAFRRRGFTTKQLPNSGKPLVFAENKATPDVPTILFYIHFDGMPVIPAQWAQKSP